jgi:phospholipid/cholesterol/gamma-HCH transport system substrate-binding protein
MKINNETKVGILAIVALVILILGFNYLKGKTLFKRSDTLYAVFSNIGSLDKSNPVKINGLPIGSVYDFGPRDKEVTGIIVTIHLNRSVSIPKNSIAIIEAAFVGSSYVTIEKGDSKEYAKSGDTINTRLNAGILSDFRSRLSPTMQRVNEAVDSLKLVLGSINAIFDTRTNNNLQQLIANLLVSSIHLQQLLNAQSGALAHSLNNMEAVTGNLAKNNDLVTATLANLQTVSTKLANARIDELVAVLEGTVNELKTTIGKVGSNNGSLGKLLNDNKLYDNLNNAVLRLQVLLDDVRVNPKRYVNISVFGRKDKSGPLTSPSQIDTLSGRH